MARTKKAEAVQEVKQELTFKEELEQILAKPGKDTFKKLCELRARIEKELQQDPELADLFFEVNDEMGKAV